MNGHTKASLQGVNMPRPILAPPLLKSRRHTQGSVLILRRLNDLLTVPNELQPLMTTRALQRKIPNIFPSTVIELYLS